MAMAEHILLVEGESDRSFFEAVCKTLKLQPSVTVAPPKDVGGSHNTKEGVFNHLPILLNQLGDAQITHLAVVVDADSAVNGGGCQRAIDKVTKIVEPYGFTLASNPVGGVFFQNDDGLADFGLWVMPNNSDEGMLEDWIKSCIHPVNINFLRMPRPWWTNCHNPSSNRYILARQRSRLGWLGRNSPGTGFIVPLKIN